MKAFDRPVNHFMLLISFYSEHIENKKFSVAFRGYKKANGIKWVNRTPIFCCNRYCFFSNFKHHQEKLLCAIPTPKSGLKF